MSGEAKTERKTSAGFVPSATPPLSGWVKEVCKRTIARWLHFSGLMRGIERLARTHELRTPPGFRLPRLRRSSSTKFGILCYHRVGTDGVPRFSRLDPGVFEAQMRYLRKHYRIVSLGQLCRELQEGESVEPTVSITFDDGYRDLYTHAFPVLQRYQIPATIYLIGRCMETGEVPWYDRIFVGFEVAPGPVLELDIGGPQRFELSSPAARTQAAWETVCKLRGIPDSLRRKWCATFERQISLPEDALQGRMLDWKQVRTMHRGEVFFGAHTMTHPVVSQLPPYALAEELGRSKRCLEQGLDAPVEDFAYPFGKEADIYSSVTQDFLVHAGYRSAVTTVEGCNTPGVNPYRLRRMQISDDSSLASFAFNLGRMFLETPSALTASLRTMNETVDGQVDAADGVL